MKICAPIGIAAILLTGCASTSTCWDRQGTSQAEIQTAMDQCENVARPDVAYRTPEHRPYSLEDAYQGIIIGINNEGRYISAKKLQQDLFKDCMVAQGYREHPIVQ